MLERRCLRGRSPLSERIVISVRQSGLCVSWTASERSCWLATRQRRASSSYSLRSVIFNRIEGVRTYLAQDVHAVNEAEHVEVREDV